MSALPQPSSPSPMPQAMAVPEAKWGGWPLRVSVASVVVIAMLVVAFVVVGLGWVGARESLVATATRTAHDIGVLTNERSLRLLEPVQSTLRQLSFDPLVTARTPDERLARLHVLTEELKASQLVSAVYVGYPNGEFILARRLDVAEVKSRFDAPADATVVVQTQTLALSQTMAGTYLFYDAADRLVQKRAAPDYQFDPRTRGWFDAALKGTGAVLSPPYVFFSTRRVGVTLSQAARSGGAVIGIDVALDDLSELLGQLRMTPGSHLALVNDRQEVLAHPDMHRMLHAGADGQFSFKRITDINEPSLMKLSETNPAQGQVTLMDVDGARVLGVVLPFHVWKGHDIRLLMTAPVEELLGDLPAKRRRLLWVIGGLVLLMLPLGWLAGGRIGHSLNQLAFVARRVGHFDFSAALSGPSFVKEVNTLSGAVSGMSRTIQRFLALSQTMATEPHMEQMLDNVLHQLVLATRCHAAAIYLWDDDAQALALHAVDAPPPAQALAQMFPQHWPNEDPATHNSGAAAPAWGSGLTHLGIALRGRTGPLQGHLVLVHQTDADHADPAFFDFAHRLSGMLAVSIETRQLIAAQKNLLDAIIRLLADAIDAKSPYTGGHCERVPQLATLLVDRMGADTEGPYTHFSLTEEERYEFHLGAWLHDCGKVTSPEYIVDKATKLEVIHNRIHEVRTRFEVLWRDAELAHLQRLVDGADAAASQATLARQHQQLQSDFAFVAQCNVGGEFMADEALARLKTIAAQTWQRHFDNRQGLAIEEASRLAQAQPDAPVLPVTEYLLADRPEHVVPWGDRKPAVEKNDPRNLHGFDMVLPATQQNMGELYNLSIRRGTLTDEDRFKINDHIVQTYIMLKGLPWPQHLARVPEIAATHHEKMDGKGYPRKLPAERLTVLDRVMALADVFEALTAADRPYKAPKTLTDSLRIMAFMCKDQHLDTELFRYFLHSGLWRTYAGSYMKAEQIDAVDVATIEKLLPAAPAPAALVSAALVSAALPEAA